MQRKEAMTKTYAQIVKQIEVLKQDAEKARRKEIEGVVSRIRGAIKVYGLTADDLGFGSKKISLPNTGTAASTAPGAAPSAATMPTAAPIKRRARKGSKPAKPAAVVKFRNDTGGTWGGIGKRPQWLRDALNAGKQLGDFAVK